MDINKVLVAGSGVLGSQIAFQSAYCGYEVVILIRKEDSKEEVKNKINKLYDTYKEIAESVNENYKSICELLKIDSKNIIRPYQTHTNNIKEVNEEQRNI